MEKGKTEELIFPVQCRKVVNLSIRSLGLHLAILLSFVLSSDAFNLENRLPLNKFHQGGSYFGYSVAEHVQTDGPEDLKW